LSLTLTAGPPPGPSASTSGPRPAAIAEVVELLGLTAVCQLHARPFFAFGALDVRARDDLHVVLGDLAWRARPFAILLVLERQDLGQRLEQA